MNGVDLHLDVLAVDFDDHSLIGVDFDAPLTDLGFAAERAVFDLEAFQGRCRWS